MRALLKSKITPLLFGAIALVAISCKSNSAKDLSRLIKELDSPDGKVRNSAALSIASYGKDGEKAVPSLIRLLNSDPNNGIKTSAAFALRSIDTKDARAALDSYQK